MSTLDQQAKAALKRLNADWQEIQQSPILGVSAVPLEKDIFEWHCNFEFEATVYHVILYFPKNYPAKSPSAEFISGIEFSGATKRGPKGGTQVCLSIFSDFAMVHDEWANQKGTGWSPSYTVQTVLLNLLSFLVETSSGRSYYAYGASSKSGTVAAARAYKCPDCGHTHETPFPALPSSDATTRITPFSEITCYVTRLNIVNLKKEIFGFGIVKPENARNPNYTSPCEYITYNGFGSLRESGKVESVMREEVHYFLPLYVNPTHAKNIASYFEESLREILPGPASYETKILNVLPKLMNSAVLAFMNGKTHASERAMHGYFAFHRLFIWATAEYNLAPTINQKIQDFLDNPHARLKRNTPNLGDWITYLTVAPHARWNDVATTFLHEAFLRDVMWYVKEQPALGDVTDTHANRTRVEDTFRLTKVSRYLIAFQVLFLDVARPANLTLKQVAARYDENNGLPTQEMMSQMGEVVARIKKGIRNFAEFFEVLKIEPCPTATDVIEMLKENVAMAGQTDGYFMRGANVNVGRGVKRGGESVWERLKKRARESAEEEKRQKKVVKEGEEEGEQEKAKGQKGMSVAEEREEKSTEGEKREKDEKKHRHDQKNREADRRDYKDTKRDKRDEERHYRDDRNDDRDEKRHKRDRGDRRDDYSDDEKRDRRDRDRGSDDNRRDNREHKRDKKEDNRDKREDRDYSSDKKRDIREHKREKREERDESDEKRDRREHKRDKREDRDNSDKKRDKREDKRDKQKDRRNYSDDERDKRDRMEDTRDEKRDKRR